MTLSWSRVASFTLDSHMKHLRRIVSVAFNSRYEYELYHLWNWILIWITFVKSDDRMLLSVAPQPRLGRNKYLEASASEPDDGNSDGIGARDDSNADSTGSRPPSSASQKLEGGIAGLLVSPNTVDDADEDEDLDPTAEPLPSCPATPEPTPSEGSSNSDKKYNPSRTPDFATYAHLNNNDGKRLLVFIHEIKPFPAVEFQDGPISKKLLDDAYEREFKRLRSQVVEQAQLAFEDYPDATAIHAMAIVGIRYQIHSFTREDTPAFGEYTDDTNWYNISKAKEVVNSRNLRSSRASDYTLPFKRAWTTAFNNLDAHIDTYLATLEGSGADDENSEGEEEAGSVTGDLVDVDNEGHDI